MALPFAPPIEPMLAKASDEIPLGPQWRYEPKWDGFRTLIFKTGDDVYLQSRNGQPMARYFPEMVELARERLKGDCILDGELFVPTPRGLDFDTLQSRIHPAASRVLKLSKEIPASFVAFDLLAVGEADWRERPFAERRAALLECFASDARFFITPQTEDPEVARHWFDQFEGAGLDGVIARVNELPYVSGERVMAKIKHGRTADCVVGGFREGKTPSTVGALLLGLYDQNGVLHHIGHTSSFTAKQKRELFEKFSALKGDSFGQGRTPGTPSRWSQGKDASYISVAPTQVCEVKYDYLQGPRFRHGATFVRWRIDKNPTDCLWSQLDPPHPFSLDAVLKLAPGGR